MARNKPPAQPRPHKDAPSLLFMGIIILTGFLIYANSLSGKFIWDDKTLVRDNASIRNWSHAGSIFGENVMAGAARKSQFYRPLQVLTYTVDYSLWKLDTRGYHLTNVILHVLVALALWHLVEALFGDTVLSCITALLFVAHPIHTEAVSYISGRADLLSSLFLLVSLIFYVRYAGLARTGPLLVIALSFTGALLSKEYSLIMPAVLLLYHVIFRKPVCGKAFSLVAAIALIYVSLRATVLHFPPSYSPPSTTLLERLPGVFVALFTYVKLLLIPVGLHMEYGNRLFSMSQPSAVAGLAVACMLVFLIVRVRKSRGPVLFGASFFIITLLPVSNLIPLNAFMAEHWLYLPSIGFFLIAADIITAAYRRPSRMRTLSVAIGAALVLAYSCLTVHHNRYWQDPAFFYERTLHFAPASPRLYDLLGTEYGNRDRNEDAVALFKKSILLDPNYTDAYGNLGNVYARMGKTSDAAEAFENVIRLAPGDARAYNNLANMRIQEGKYADAIALYEKAIALNPRTVQAYVNLGNAYSLIGKDNEAILACTRALAINPNMAEAYCNIGNAQRNLAQFDEAVRAYEKAISINPGFARAHMNLALTYYDLKRYDLAIQHCDRASELGQPPDPGFLELLRPHREGR